MPSSSDLGVVDLLQIVNRRKGFVLLFMFFCMAVGVGYVLLGKVWYRAEVVVARATDRQATPGLSQLGGLASLAGIGLNTGGESQTNLAVLDSRALAADFISSEGLIPVLFPEKWDQAKREWRVLNGKAPPDLQDAVSRLKRQNLQVRDDKKSGLIIVAVVWPEPKRGAELANAVVGFANERLRKKALAEAQQNVDFLRKELAATTVASLQQSLAQLLESEMRKLLIARGSEEFAFKVVDAAVAPKRSTRPSMSVVLVVSAFAGAIVGGLLLLLRAAWLDASRLQDRRSQET